MSDTIKHSPELAAACQYINDLRIKKALQESSMSVLLTEEFSSSDFIKLVQSIANVLKLLPNEMDNSQKRNLQRRSQNSQDSEVHCQPRLKNSRLLQLFVLSLAQSKKLMETTVL